MSFVDMLVEVGFDHAAAIELSQDESFKSRCQNRTATELTGRIVRISNIYSITITDTLKIISAFPPFAGYNHERVIKGIKAAYGFTDQQVSKIVSSFPSFAGLNHERVSQKLNRVGNLIGIDSEMIRAEILKNPALAGYSVRRYIAVIDVFRQLKREHDGISNDVMAHLWLRRSTLSPYVPDTDMLRVSQAVRRNEYHEEPKLMQVIRKDLSKLRSAST